MVVEDGHLKNAELLPFWDGTDSVVLSKKEQYRLEVAKNQAKLSKV